MCSGHTGIGIKANSAQWAKLGGQKELCENSKIKDLEPISTRIHIRKHEKDMSSQIKWC